MLVQFNFDGETLYSYVCSDVAGIIAAAKESESIHFGADWYKFDSIVLTHYMDDDNQMRQQLIIYVKE